MAKRVFEISVMAVALVLLVIASGVGASKAFAMINSDMAGGVAFGISLMVVIAFVWVSFALLVYARCARLVRAFNEAHGEKEGLEG